MGNENRIELCFDLLEDYEENIRQALLENDINQEEIEHILRNFYFKNDLIFSLNKEYKKGESFLEFCQENDISNEIPDMLKFNGSLYRHQEKAIKSILDEKCTVISTGTGSGKTESFLIPILDYCIKNRGEKGVKAVIVYPMNALASDQLRRIEDAVRGRDITYAIFNGETPEKNTNNQDTDSEKITSREDIIENKPDILVTNYVMLERILTNPVYNRVFDSEKNIFKYIVLDEIHTYNGNKALNIKYLLHRLRHRVCGNIVQIGCSATLSSNRDGKRTDGYIYGDVKKFIRDIFDIPTEGGYSYIEPYYEKIKYINNNSVYDKYDGIDPKITSIIKNALSEGSKNFNELLKILKDNNIVINDEELKAYFTKVLELNEKYHDKSSILDFRVHLFLLQIGDNLRRCVKCGKHYSCYIERCNECGHIILPVYQKDTNLLIGELKDDVIVDPLRYTPISNKNLVLLNFNKNKRYKYEHTLKFRSYETFEESIKLNIEEEGENEVYYIDESDPNVIEFKPKTKTSFEYKLLKNTLKGLDDNNKKILCFIDNREKCGRYSTVFGDEFLSDFYYEILKYVNGDNYKTIYDTKEELYEFLVSQINLCDSIKENLKERIIKEFNLWFRRFIILNSALYGKKNEIIEFHVENDLNSLEKSILEICLKEGIYFKQDVTETGEIIRLNKKYFIFGKGIGFSSFEGRAISLSEDSRKYKEVVKELGQDKIKQAIVSLVSKGILEEELQNRDNHIQGDIHFPNSIFYLNSKKVLIKTKKSNCIDFHQIVKENLFFTGAHSSEIEEEKRKENENKFQNGEINLLIATPTLEMGIDIGTLSFVYMIGVPPVPSNYAQRAGRAGRRGDRFAGIITVCSETSNHDWHYFHNPKEMIEGLINPPKFDTDNTKVLNKHVNTLIYPKIIDQLKGTISHDYKVILENHCEDVFNCAVYIDEQIDMLKYALRNFKYKLSNNNLYNEGIYPNYSFSREEIQLIEEKQKDIHDKEEKAKVLATRHPEFAYKQIDLETSLFIGDQYYYIKAKDDDMFESMDKVNVLNMWKITCINNERNINKDKEFRKKQHYININLNKEDSIRYTRGPISIYFQKQMKMEFITQYLSKDYNIFAGYQLLKDAIIFEFDNNVISDKQYISSIVLLHKVIKMMFGLDSEEFGLIIEGNVKINGVDNLVGINKVYGILYDKDGNQNIDMNVILEAIDNNEVFEIAYDLISKCECEKISGCYLCIKSYETKWVYDKLDKYLAKNVVAYLMKKETLIPKITTMDEIISYEMEINIKQKDGGFLMKIDDKEEVLENKSNQNETVLYGLYKKLKYIYKNDDIETIMITSNIDRIVNGLNGECKLNGSNMALNLFYFYKQAFLRIDAKIVK